ncbi:MAG: hypothetical protein IPO60_02865 [Flavobacteriales bacterium]|nr:hypothetical protein [Flavobacteriales bacterium]MBK7286175.1 hypothetical protein [Flavobacteriales bacterium]MBK9059986.1 hypothetical protein [Flavobacteriales bacterium]MBK9597282.1 hypothetical protein [Flavobacteriales bacterium]QQS71942.1 MAG: hypothetical protein IPP95_12240 [Flavobacteriales bacterium]
MTNFFFGLGHFLQWTFEFIVAANWTIPVLFIAVLLFGMAFWLRTQTVLSRKAKDRDAFI